MKTFISSALVAMSVTTAFAAETFVVDDIIITGNKRVPKGTILTHLPVKVGDTLSQNDTPKIIQKLYQTKFFTDIELTRQGNALVVRVSERPTIGAIKLDGNKTLKRERVNAALKELGLERGKVFDKAVLDEVANSLQNEYHNQGKYNARVDVKVKKLSRNRVSVNIDISEGKTAKIRQINIIGNEVFSDKTLLKQLHLTTPKLTSILTKAHQYSKPKLDGDLETLRSYYMDRGYLNFDIESTQVSLTTDKKYVYIIIRIKEGPVYRLSSFDITGSLPVAKDKLLKLSSLKSGETFSREKVIKTGNKMTNILGNEGYAFANINPVPDINEDKREVAIDYQIETGPKVYVNKISFSGNSSTSDVVLRRELRQMEGSIFGTDKVEESLRQIRLLDYIKQADVKTTPTPGTDDQVDLEFNVDDLHSAQFVMALAYSAADGFLFNIGLTENNFLGSGKYVGINFDRASWYSNYNLTIGDPYYTESGISRNINLYGQFTEDRGNTADYRMDSFGGSINYGMPMSDDDYFSLGYGYDKNRISVTRDSSDQPTASTEIVDFLNKYGDNFRQLLLYTGWTHNGYNRAYLPTKGLKYTANMRVAVPVSRDRSLLYYTAGYDMRWYQPIYKDTLFSFAAGASYGDGYGKTKELPFYQHFYSGGMGSVRGYESYQLGPRDSKNRAYGGNLAVNASANLILPKPISTDSLRTSLFIDAGNVYLKGAEQTKSSGPLRYGAGVGIEWQSPVGPFEFSVAVPLRKRSGDRTQLFDFSIGTRF